MSLIDYGVPDTGDRYAAPVKVPGADKVLHRLREVRRQQGVSRTTVARRLKTDVRSVQWQERETSDLTLSLLYQWQKVLEVPISELLVDNDEPLSPPVMKRAQFVRLMKTAAAILERAQNAPLRRMAQMLVDQLVEIMPELKTVSAWNAVGQRRTLDELGQAAERTFSLDALADLVD